MYRAPAPRRVTTQVMTRRDSGHDRAQNRQPLRNPAPAGVVGEPGFFLAATPGLNPWPRAPGAVGLLTAPCVTCNRVTPRTPSPTALDFTRARARAVSVVRPSPDPTPWVCIAHVPVGVAGWGTAGDARHRRPRPPSRRRTRSDAQPRKVPHECLNAPTLGRHPHTLRCPYMTLHSPAGHV